MTSTCSIVARDRKWFLRLPDPFCAQLNFQCVNDQLDEKDSILLLLQSQNKAHQSGFFFLGLCLKYTELLGPGNFSIHLTKGLLR